jgi:hypothetical protein
MQRTAPPAPHWYREGDVVFIIHDLAKPDFRFVVDVQYYRDLFHARTTEERREAVRRSYERNPPPGETGALGMLLDLAPIARFDGGRASLEAIFRSEGLDPAALPRDLFEGFDGPPQE